MYPFIRMAYQVRLAKRASRLPLTGSHITRHRCWPWDLDFWLELNNGRTLTLFDLGRIPLAVRTGLTDVLRDQRWGMTVAGTTVRFRRRIRLFHRVEMCSRIVGWDDKFIYVDQTMWKDGECTTQGLFRMAVTDKTGIVPPRRVAEAMQFTDTPPQMPDWVKSWIDADSTRPWPPERPE